jgi:hypothetical protein
MAHEPTLGVPHLLGRVMSSVHNQLRERLCSPWQRGCSPRRAVAPGGVTVILHLVVLPGLKHHHCISNASVIVAF